MSPHRTDADERLAALMRERELQEHSEWFATLSLEEQIAWLQQAGKTTAESISRTIARLEARTDQREKRKR